MPDARYARLLRLLAALRGRTARNARDLARDLNVSERTIYRDLTVLQQAGVGCAFDRDGGGYRVGGDFFLPPVQLTLAEALALSVLGAEVARKNQVPLLGAAWQAVAKIRGQLPAAVRDGVADADGHVRVHGARVSPQDGCEEKFEAIRQAISQGRKVRCAYAGGHADGRRPFLFRPYALLFGQRAWYAVGYSELRGAERSLKLNRLVSVELTDRPYGVPDGWTVEKSLGKAWRMIRGPRRYAVEIAFDAEVGPNVADTLWHPTQTVVRGADGSCRFRCDVDGLDEIVWWVLGYGPHAEVVAPADLRARVRRLADDTRRRYDPGYGRAPALAATAAPPD